MQLQRRIELSESGTYRASVPGRFARYIDHLHAPWDATEDFTNDKRLDVGSEEEYEDEAGHGYQSTDHGSAVAVPFAHEAVDEQANDFSSTGAVGPTLNCQNVLVRIP